VFSSLITMESPTIARLCGDANRGVAPRRIPLTPAIPAIVVVVPVGVTLRMVLTVSEPARVGRGQRIR
jgi:hypothetical protein